MLKDVLVIGDSCRDIFVYCDAKKLCPDLPVPALTIVNQTENSGMAKNVQRNIVSKINSCDIITNKNWHNITKTRYVHEKTNHTFFRVDTPDNISPINLDEINYDYKIIVISDYDKGFLSESDIETISKNHDCVFLDTKKILGEWVKYCKFIKINDFEYKNSKNNINNDLINKIIHTMGGDGCEYKGVRYQVNKVDVKDSSGAGDSFMAALVVKYLETNDIIESIKFANKKASEVVTQIGVGII